MAEEKVAEQVLNSLEIDTIGEILNISMGSAAQRSPPCWARR